MSTKNRLFSALPLETLLLNVFYCFLTEFKGLQCGLLHPASCTDRAIHAFPNKTQGPLALKYFLLSFNGRQHPLGSTIAEARPPKATVVHLCVPASQFLCYNRMADMLIHVIQWNFRARQACVL